MVWWHDDHQTLGIPSGNFKFRLPYDYKYSDVISLSAESAVPSRAGVQLVRLYRVSNPMMAQQNQLYITLWNMMVQQNKLYFPL